MLQLIPQKNKGSQETMNNYMPTSYTMQKKWINPQKHTNYPRVNDDEIENLNRPIIIMRLIQ